MDEKTIGDQQLRVLALVAESANGCTAWDIAARLGKISSSGTTKTLKTMQRDGLVVGVRPAGPGSRPVWTVTGEGRRVWERTRTRRGEQQQAGAGLAAVVYGFVAGSAASFVLPEDTAALEEWVARCRARVADPVAFDTRHALVAEHLRRAREVNACGMYPALTWSEGDTPVTVSYFEYPRPAVTGGR